MSLLQKPVGVYSPGFGVEPIPFLFGPIGDMVTDTEIDQALRKSELTGFKWILQMGYQDNPLTRATVVAERDLKRFQKLMPHIVAMIYMEEVVEHFNAGDYARFGFPANYPNGQKLVIEWMGYQNAQVKQVMQKPTIWLTHLVYSGQPVPSNIDYVAIDAYAGDNESLAWAETRLLHAEVATDLPLIVIPRWFKATGKFQGAGWQDYSKDPSVESIDFYFRILARPRYIAMLGFLYESRPYADLVGLKDMPGAYSYVLSKMQ